MENNNPGIYILKVPLITKLGETSNRNGVTYTKSVMEDMIAKYLENGQIPVALGRDLSNPSFERVSIDLQTVVGTMKSYTDDHVDVAIKSKAKYDLVKDFVENHGYRATFSIIGKIGGTSPNYVLEKSENDRIICIDLLE